MAQMNESLRWYKPMEKGSQADLEEDKKQRAGHLISETATIEQRQSTWHELNLWNATLYTNRELIGFRWGAGEAEKELQPANLRTENLIELIGERMLSKAASSPLKPTLTPTGVSYEVENAVRLLDEFLFATWRQVEAEDACAMMFSDSFIASLGCVRVAYDKRKKTLHAEDVFFDNIIIDNRECANRAPPRTYRIRQVLPKATVEATYGIELNPGKEPYVEYREIGDGYVVLVEAWRLPDANGKGGYHAIACCDQMIVDQAWDHDWVPLVFFHWQDRRSGFFTKSGVEQLIPYQVRQNELNDDIKVAQDLYCRMRMLIHANTQIEPDQWDSEMARFLMYTGTKPEAFVWNVDLNPLFNERERNAGKAHAFMGISEMFTSADLPDQVRLDSSAGVREFRNLEDAAHLRLWSRYEKARLDVAKMLLRVLSISEGADQFSAVFSANGASAEAKRIPFEAVKELLADQYSWSMEATPLSMMSPAARRELLRDFTSRGQVEAGSDEARRIEGNPNLERVDKLEMASTDDIIRHLQLLEKGKYEAPTNLTNTTAGIPMVTANLHRLKKFPTVKRLVLENHIRWIAAAVAIKVKASRPPPQQIPFAPTQGMPGTNAATAPPPPSQ